MANNWVDLPLDLLETISDYCILPDRIRMQSVCKSWRSILKNSVSRELPWLMMIHKVKEEDGEEEQLLDTRDFFSMSKQSITTISIPEMRGKRCCASFNNGWLMTVDDDFSLSLFHPWSRKKIDLPHQSTLDYPPCAQASTNQAPQATHQLNICKAALSDDGNMVGVVYSHGDLGFCRIGDEAWTLVEGGGLMEDLIYHKGLFYAFSFEAGLYFLRIEDGCIVDVERLTVDMNPSGLVYMAPDAETDTLLVIDRTVDHMYMGDDVDDPPPTCDRTIRVVIYRTPLAERVLNGGNLNEYTKVDSLGDRVMFLGYNSPIIVEAREFPGLKGNHIYFVDSCSESYPHNDRGCCGLVVFNVEDGTVEQIFEERFYRSSSPPTWIATPPYSLERDFGESLCLERTHIST